MSSTSILIFIFVFALVIITMIVIAGFRHLDTLYYEETSISMREHRFTGIVLGVLYMAFVAFSTTFVAAVAGA